MCRQIDPFNILNTHNKWTTRRTPPPLTLTWIPLTMTVAANLNRMFYCIDPLASSDSICEQVPHLLQAQKQHKILGPSIGLHSLHTDLCLSFYICLYIRNLNKFCTAVCTEVGFVVLYISLRIQHFTDKKQNAYFCRDLTTIWKRGT
jgi:hypothetical protein